MPLQRDLLDAQNRPLRRDLFDYAGSLMRQPSLHCQIDPVKAPDYRCEPLDVAPALVGEGRHEKRMYANERPDCPYANIL